MYEIKSKVVLNRCAPDMNLAFAAAAYKQSSNSSTAPTYEGKDFIYIHISIMKILDMSRLSWPFMLIRSCIYDGYFDHDDRLIQVNIHICMRMYT
jgi:hypothetical protein